MDALAGLGLEAAAIFPPDPRPSVSRCAGFYLPPLLLLPVGFDEDES